MSTEDKTKVLEKIKKCLALSKSSNEHEAAAALRQAQKMMAMHNLTDDDIEGIDYVCCDVMTDYEFGKKKPVVIISVASLMQHALGVECVFSIGRKDNFRGAVHMVVYCGVRHKVHIAVYAHTVVWRAVTAAWKRYSTENPHMKKLQGARAGFYHGWCETVRGKVAKLLPEKKEQEGTQKAIAKRFDNGLGKAKAGSTNLVGEACAAGSDAGKDFELNKPINQDRARIGRDKS